MRYFGAVLSVADIGAARAFYEDLFGLEVFQDYGKNIAFTCGLALQQDFDWLTGLPKERIAHRPNNMELCFEERDFDAFLSKLKAYPNIDDRAQLGAACRPLLRPGRPHYRSGRGDENGCRAFSRLRHDDGRCFKAHGCPRRGFGKAAKQLEIFSENKGQGKPRRSALPFFCLWQAHFCYF